MLLMPSRTDEPAAKVWEVPKGKTGVIMKHPLHHLPLHYMEFIKSYKAS